MLRTPRLILDDVNEVTALVQRIQVSRVGERKIIKMREYNDTAISIQTCKAPSYWESGRESLNSLAPRKGSC